VSVSIPDLTVSSTFMYNIIGMIKNRLIKTVSALSVAVAFLQMAAGCSSVIPETGCATVNYTFEAVLDPDMVVLTKGGSETPAVSADRCVMEIFYNGVSFVRKVEPVVNGIATITVPVVAGRTYDIAFWADKAGCYNAESLKNVTYAGTYDYSDDSMDAFCVLIPKITLAQNGVVLSVTLKRPLAKVTVTNAPAQAVKFKAPSSYNVLEDLVSPTLKDFEYSNSSTMYLFVPATKTTVDMTIGSTSCTSIPIMRNYKTNVIIN